MIYRPTLPRGYSLDPKSGLALPNELRAFSLGRRSPASRSRRRGPGSRAASVAGGGGGGDEFGEFRVFATEWNTALGTSNAAVMDTGRTRSWDERPTGQMEVRQTAGSGLDFPTENFLANRVNFDGGGAGGHLAIYLQTNHGIPAPAIGHGMTMRYYYAWLAPEATDPGLDFHPSYWGPAANATQTVLGIAYRRENTPPAGAVDTWGCNVGGAGNFIVGGPKPYGSVFPAMVNAPSAERIEIPDLYVVRFEMRYDRTSESGYTIGAACYDNDAAGGGVLVEEEDWQGWDGAAPWDRLVDTAWDDGNDAMASLLDRWISGCNGVDDNGSVERDVSAYGAEVIYWGPSDELPWPVGQYTEAERLWEAA